MIEKLKQLGLTKYESKIYLALLKYGSMGSRKISEKSEVPPTRVHDTLRSLEGRGVAIKIQENPMIFKPMDKDTAIKNIVNKKISDLQSLKEDVLKSLKNVKQIKKDEIIDKVKVMVGHGQLFSKVDELLACVEKNYYVFSVGESVPNYYLKMWRKIIKRGIDSKFIVTKNDQENKELIEKFYKYEIPMRFYPIYPNDTFSFGIFDEKISIITIKNSETPKERISLLLDSPGLSMALLKFFKETWKKGKPISL